MPIARNYGSWLRIYIYAGFILLIVFAFLLFMPRITGKDHYIVHSRERRLNMINELKKDCRGQDVTYLIVTYKEELHDLNASYCWSTYMKKCFSEEAKKLQYKLKVICPEY